MGPHLLRLLAAKQEAFEESIRLKNQFRSLDEDEVEFLDSLLESTRAKEAALKKETAEQLELFHRQREEAEKAVINEEDANEASRAGAGSPTEEEQWLIPGRKRRRAKEKESFPGVKLRKASSIDAKAQSLAEESSKSKCPPADVSNQFIEPKASASSNGKDKPKEQKLVPSTSATPRQERTAPPTASSGLGLVDYDSDDD